MCILFGLLSYAELSMVGLSFLKGLDSSGFHLALQLAATKICNIGFSKFCTFLQPS